MSAPGCGSRRPPNIVRFRRFLATIIADRNKIIGLAIGPLSDHIAVLTPTQARIVDVGLSAVPRYSGGQAQHSAGVQRRAATLEAKGQ